MAGQSWSILTSCQLQLDLAGSCQDLMGSCQDLPLSCQDLAGLPKSPIILPRSYQISAKYLQDHAGSYQDLAMILPKFAKILDLRVFLVRHYGVIWLFGRLIGHVPLGFCNRQLILAIITYILGPCLGQDTKNHYPANVFQNESFNSYHSMLSLLCRPREVKVKLFVQSSNSSSQRSIPCDGHWPILDRSFPTFYANLQRSTYPYSLCMGIPLDSSSIHSSHQWQWTSWSGWYVHLIIFMQFAQYKWLNYKCYYYYVVVEGSQYIELVCGQSVVGIWLICGRYVVGIWSVCGQYVVGIWSVCGWYMVDMWSVCGWYVVCMWSVCDW